MKNVFKGIGMIILIPLFIDCSYWVAKTSSYFFFYEGFVQETIKEMVKEESLKKN